MAGDPETGRRWRLRYLDVTYGTGTYRPYPTLVAEAARSAGLDPGLAVWWHNRVHMDRGDLPAPVAEHDRLDPLVDDVLGA